MRSKPITVPFIHTGDVVSNRASEWCAVNGPGQASATIAAAHAAITFFIGTSSDTVPRPCYPFVTRLFGARDAASGPAGQNRGGYRDGSGPPLRCLTNHAPTLLPCRGSGAAGPLRHAAREVHVSTSS